MNALLVLFHYFPFRCSPYVSSNKALCERESFIYAVSHMAVAVAAPLEYWLRALWSLYNELQFFALFFDFATTRISHFIPPPTIPLYWKFPISWYPPKVAINFIDACTSFLVAKQESRRKTKYSSTEVTDGKRMKNLNKIEVIVWGLFYLQQWIGNCIMCTFRRGKIGINPFALPPLFSSLGTCLMARGLLAFLALFAASCSARRLKSTDALGWVSQTVTDPSIVSLWG